MGIGPDLHRTAGLSLIHERVHVANNRKTDLVAGALENRYGPDIDHLMDAGVRGIVAPAIRAIFGLHTPQAITT